jgi:hypothetical protein
MLGKGVCWLDKQLQDIDYACIMCEIFVTNVSYTRSACLSIQNYLHHAMPRLEALPLTPKPGVYFLLFEVSPPNFFSK